MNEMDERLPLGAMDPGSRDPGFWVRFHARVMDRARVELARRRLEVEPTIVDVVFAWRRTLIPLTLLAAGGILLMVVVLASLVPARQASGIEPMRALRRE